MNLRDISKPKTTESLNANLSKAFSQKINVDSFTLEQLQDARNKIRTKLSQFETNESYDAVLKDSSYQKNKLFLDVLNTAIAERGDVNEGAKPDYIDLDKDGDKKEPMKKAAKDKKKKPVSEDQIDEFDGVDSTDDADQNLMRAVHKKFGTKSGRNLGRFAGDRYWKSDGGYGRVPADLDVALDDPAVKMMIDAGVLTLNPSALKKYKAMYGEGSDKMPDKNKDGVPDYAQDGKGKKDAKPEEKEGKKDLSKVPPQLRKHMKKDEGKDIIENYFVHVAKLFEGEEDKAEIVMAAKDMVNRVTGWMEDTAEMQAESMLELGDAIRDEMGQVQSEQFIQTVKPGLESLYGALESTRAALTSGVAQLTGEEDPAQAMGDEMPAEEPAEEPAPEGDDFEAAEPAAGGEEEAGREKRESIERSIRLGQILSSKKK